MIIFPQRKEIIEKAKRTLSKGLDKKKVVYSIAIGLSGGIFPVLGTTTVLCIGLTFLFRANHAIVQLINWAVYPLQIIFYIPLIKLGTVIFSGPDFELSFLQVKEAFQSGFFNGIEIIGMAHLYGILAWIIVSIPLAIISYFLLSVFYDNVRKIIMNLNKA